MRILKPLILATVMAAPLAIPGAALADDRAQITVTGEGLVSVVPDIATLTLGVTTEGKTAAEALAANNEQLAAVMARLKSADIAARDIQTSNLSVSPNWSAYDAAGGQKITGYTASNMVTVTIRNLGSLGGVLDQAVSDGANTLNGLTFGLADPKPATDEARKAAVADAMARARLLTEAAGTGLGPIRAISENGGYAPPTPMLRSSAKADAVQVAEGTLDISASVTMVFDLKD